MTATLIYTVLLACTLLVKRTKRILQRRSFTKTQFSNLFKTF